MKLKFPKSILIGTQRYNIKYNPKHCGGEFHAKTFLMEIGTQGLKENLEMTFNVICHEVSEALLADMEIRFSKQDTYVFAFNHHEFILFITEFSKLISQFIR